MAVEFLRGGGEMGELIRAIDWSTTPLGPAEHWPSPLRTAVTLMLGARQPIYIAWGPQLISLYNDGYLPILGSKHPAAMGQPFDQVWPEIWEQFRPIVAQTMAGDAQFFEDMPVALTGREGRVISWFTFSYTPVRDESGAVAGFYCAAIETTERVYAARESAERLQLALDATNLGTFVWYPHEDRTDSDERMLSLFGLTRTVDLNLAEALGKLIHPDDVERYGAAVAAAMDPSGAGTLREDIRVRHGDGSEHWIAVTGRATFEGDPPRGVRLNGTATDITDRKQAEAAVLTSEAKYRSLFESMDQGYCIIEMLFDEHDRPFDYRFVEVNPAYEKQAGLNNVIGRTASELVPGLNAFWFDTFGRIARSGEAERFQSPAVAEDYSHIFDVFAFRVGEPEQHRVAVLFTDISTQVQAREELRAAARRKDEFLATLAHELRNPLAPLRTGLELLRLSGGDNAPFDRVRGMMERQVGHMVRMIDDLLDVSRITSGRIHLQRKPTPIDSLIKGAVEANSAAIEAARLSLDVRIPDGAYLVDVDATRIVQVMANLLHNATKFTPPPGRITIDAHVVDGTAIAVAVADTGEGIPHALLPQVFELFTQGERGSLGAQAGLGIGLALSRQLIELHGGRIEATSEGAGRGTTLTFTLPLVAASAATLEPAATSERSAAIPRRVLIVDDNHDAADVMGMLIEQFGGESRIAYDGESGVREAAAYQPDVVFLDLGMPGLDGYETCRRMRSQAGADAFIVALTGWGQEHDKQRAADAGFGAHLTKPADPKAIQQLLMRARQSV